MAEVIAPVDIEAIDMECALHGRQLATGEVEGMTLYWSCPVAGCCESEDHIPLEIVR